MLAQILRNYQTYLPFIVIITLILGIILIFIMISMSRRLARRSVERKALERPYPLQSLSQHFDNGKSKLSTFLHGLMNFFKRKYTGSHEQLVKSIEKVRHIMGRLYGIKAAQYQVPWYLMLGPDDSHHKFILNSIESKLFLTPDEQAIINTNDQSFKWYFYDQAVVIDHQYDLSRRDTPRQQPESYWLDFLQHIERNRPKRPLDAVIVTLPIHHIHTNGQFNNEELVAYARSVNEKLTQIQNRLGMRLPIYVVLSGCEHIAGFTDFVATLPTASQAEIFGWSSPYALDTNFTSSWVDDIFLSLREALDKIKMAVFAEGISSVNQDNNVEFTSQISNLKTNLHTYLMTLFDQHRHHEPHFLRGVYFTGKIPSHNMLPPQSEAMTDLTAQPADFVNSDSSSECAVFIKDLFNKKIFAEANLGQPIFNMLISTSKRLNLLKLVCGIGLIIWAAGLTYQFQNLRHDNKPFVSALQTINQALRGRALYTGDKQPNASNSDNSIQHLKYLDDQTIAILEKFAVINNSHTYALSMPTSWFSPLDQRINMAFAAAFNGIIIPSMSAHLIKSGHDLTANNHAFGYNDPNQIHLNPQGSLSFKVLQSYVENMAEFEQVVGAFNQQPEHRNVRNLGNIYQYIYKKNLPPQFFDHVWYYENAYAKSPINPIDIQQYRLNADQKLGKLYNIFLNMAFNINQNYPAFVRLRDDLDNLSGQKLQSNKFDGSIRNVNQEAILVADMISSEQMAWIELPTFNPSDEYQQLIHLISNSSLFGQKIAQELLKVAHQHFITFKLDLMNFKSAITGPFFAVKDNQLSASPSDGLVQFIDSFSLFLTEPFMQGFDQHYLIRKIPNGKMLFWDHAILKQTGELFDSFDNYIRNKLNQVSPDLQPLFKMIARSHLHHKIISNLGQAQLLQNPMVDQLNLSPTEALQAQVENLATATPLFAKILESLDQGVLGYDLIVIRQILVDQACDILSKIDALLDADNLYSARAIEFEKWQGAPQLGFKAFGVNDNHQLKNYLNAQRYQIQFLAKELAEPVLTLLGLGFFETASIQIPLLLKWSRIIAVLQDYDKQSPSNSLKILEQFLMHDFNNVTFENCQLDVVEWDDLAGGDDYFINILNRYRDQILSRCHAVNNQKTDVQYQTLAQYFNDHLAGHFPFTTQVEPTLSNDAAPTDVVTFFKLFDDFTKYYQQSSNRMLSTAAHKFINDVVRIRPLIVPMITANLPQQDPGLSFQIDFRTEQQHEIDGDKIIDWFINIDDRRVGIRSDRKQSYWQIGDPIDVHLRWAADGDTIPMPDNHQPQLKVTGNDAIFSYRGAWSLIYLLKAQISLKSWLQQSNTAQAQTLQFDVPTTNRNTEWVDKNLLPDTKTAQVFSRMTLNLPGNPIVSSNHQCDDASKSSQTLSLDFPTQAPVLDIVHNDCQHKKLHVTKVLQQSKVCHKLSGIKMK